MKRLIIFKGKYGATEQYAQWLSESLKIEATIPEKVKKAQLKQTDLLLIGTSIYMGKFHIAPWLKKHLEDIKNKKLFMFVVCGTPLNEKVKLSKYIHDNIPAEILHNTDIFFLPGRLIFNVLTLRDELLLKLGASAAKNLKVKKRMLTDYDDVKREHLFELIDSVYRSTSNKVQQV